jgi:cell division protein FtsL
MIHRGLLFWSATAVATAVGLFAVKYKVQDLEEKIDRTNQKIVESQQATHILRIEWAHLNEAERIERLAVKHLQLEPASIKQVIRLDSLKSDSSHERATTSPRRQCPVVVASQRRPAAPRRPPHPLQGVHPDPRRPLDRPRSKSRLQRVRLATARAPQSRSMKSSRVTKGVVGETVAQVCLARTGRRGKRGGRRAFRDGTRATPRRPPASGWSSPPCCSS